MCYAMQDSAPPATPLDLSHLRPEDQEKTRRLIYSLLREQREVLFKLSHAFNYSSGGVLYFPVLLQVLKPHKITVNTFAVLATIRREQPVKGSQLFDILPLWNLGQLYKYLQALTGAGLIRSHRARYSTTLPGMNLLDKLVREYYDLITSLPS